MSYERLAYDDQDTTGQMHSDCLVCASQIRLPHQALSPEPVDLEVERQQVRFEVSVATADLAARLMVD